MMKSALASTTGSIVAELVTNSFKYAYAGGHSGAVDVSFRHSGQGRSLRVADGGVGLPDGFDAAKGSGVGMRVVNALVRRLDATLAVESGPGRTLFRIESVQ